MNHYHFTIAKVNTLSGLINEIIDKNNTGNKPVTIISIQGFVSCMATLYDCDYSTKINEDEGSVHLGIYEGKTMIAAVTMIKELKKVA